MKFLRHSGEREVTGCERKQSSLATSRIWRSFYKLDYLLKTRIAEITQLCVNLGYECGRGDFSNVCLAFAMEVYIPNTRSFKACLHLNLICILRSHCLNVFENPILIKIWRCNVYNVTKSEGVSTRKKRPLLVKEVLALYLYHAVRP